MERFIILSVVAIGCFAQQQAQQPYQPFNFYMPMPTFGQQQTGQQQVPLQQRAPQQQPYQQIPQQQPYQMPLQPSYPMPAIVQQPSFMQATGPTPIAPAPIQQMGYPQDGIQIPFPNFYFNQFPPPGVPLSQYAQSKQQPQAVPQQPAQMPPRRPPAPITTTTRKPTTTTTTTTTAAPTTAAPAVDYPEIEEVSNTDVQQPQGASGSPLSQQKPNILQQFNFLPYQQQDQAQPTGDVPQPSAVAPQQPAAPAQPSPPTSVPAVNVPNIPQAYPQGYPQAYPQAYPQGYPPQQYPSFYFMPYSPQQGLQVAPPQPAPQAPQAAPPAPPTSAPKPTMAAPAIASNGQQTSDEQKQPMIQRFFFVPYPASGQQGAAQVLPQQPAVAQPAQPVQPAPSVQGGQKEYTLQIMIAPQMLGQQQQQGASQQQPGIILLPQQDNVDAPQQSQPGPFSAAAPAAPAPQKAQPQPTIQFVNVAGQPDYRANGEWQQWLPPSQ